MNKLYKGDCLEVMKLIPSGSIDAIITDPPYGTTACKWDSVINFELMWEQLNRIIKPNGAIVLFGSEPFSSALRMSNIGMFQYDIVWEKSLCASFHHAKSRPLKIHENVIIFSKGKSSNNANLRVNYYPQMSKGLYEKKPSKETNKPSDYRPNRKNNIKKSDKNYNGNLRYPNSVIKYTNASNKNRGLHPTQKPIALMEYLIKTYTKEGETVLDFTMGSGSTGVAAKNLNRNFIGIEQDDKYFDIATERINEEEPQKELF